MNHVYKGAVIAVTALLLAGCDTTPAGPRTVDNEGRAVVQAPEAVALFMKACFRPGATQSGMKRAIAADKNITDKGGVEGFILARHSSKAISLVSVSDGNCAVSFDSGAAPETAAKEAIVQVIPQVKPTGFGGKKGGGQVTMKTAKGTVVVTNNQKRKSQGATISLYKR
ncbi:MAG: hypothetical protein P8Q26_14340 [Ascidiaceihabitans sp.]|jgi:hypothetical protein|nr:hypothetical protein [Ascidiaceihabitans sp.]